MNQCVICAEDDVEFDPYGRPKTLPYTCGDNETQPPATQQESADQPMIIERRKPCAS